MPVLVSLCEAAGFRSVRTLIASGNVVFDGGGLDPEAAGGALEAQLAARFGRPVAVLTRTAAEMASVVARNPFPGAPPNQVSIMFLPGPATEAVLDGVTGRNADERIAWAGREIMVHHGSGIGRSRLRIPAAIAGTARNMNTVARLAAMAAGD